MNSPPPVTRRPRTRLHWPLIVGLGTVALVRPLVSIVEHQLDVTDPWWVPVGTTVLITAVWVAVVGGSRISRPVLILTLVGVVYAVLAIALSGILSPILSGSLEGPLTQPWAIIPMVLFNAGWGALAGVLALAVQRARR